MLLNGHKNESLIRSASRGVLYKVMVETAQAKTIEACARRRPGQKALVNLPQNNRGAAHREADNDKKIRGRRPQPRGHYSIINSLGGSVCFTYDIHAAQEVVRAAPVAPASPRESIVGPRRMIALSWARVRALGIITHFARGPRRDTCFYAPKSRSPLGCASSLNKDNIERVRNETLSARRPVRWVIGLWLAPAGPCSHQAAQRPRMAAALGPRGNSQPILEIGRLASCVCASTGGCGMRG